MISGRQRGWLAAMCRAVLLLLEGPYRIVMWVRNRAYDTGALSVHAVSRPVISVGNLTLGGTGKTPFVAWLARELRNRDIRVSLISRGYGATEHGRNDEAQELELLLPDVPHLQNPNRIDAARIAIEELDTELIVLDDGFQHRRLHRDLDIVLIDATEPDGFGHVFPRGTLREAPAELRRADAIVLTRCHQSTVEERARVRNWIQRHAPKASWSEFAHWPESLVAASGRSMTIEWLANKRIAAFCGIGNPANFRRTLEATSAQLVAWREFPDHHSYNRQDLTGLAQWTKSLTPLDAVLCTQKDLVKIGLEMLGPSPLYALQIAMQACSDITELQRQIAHIVPRRPESEAV